MGLRPKILTALTVPSGGWNLEFTLSNSGTLDTPLTATIPAGDYFVAWDSQTDDLIHEVAKQMRLAIEGVGGGFETGRGVTAYIDTDHKVNIRFIGNLWDEDVNAWDNDVEISWSTSHADLVKALGADASDDFSSTSENEPTWTAPRQHGWAWYATEDGQLADLGKPRADFREATVTQSRALDGSTKTVQWATRYRSSVNLGWLTAAQTWSDGQGYGDTPTATEYPYNQGLECWFEEAAKGTRFRVYEHDPLLFSDPGATEIGSVSSIATSYIEDSGKSWGQDPQAYKDYVVAFGWRGFAGGKETPGRFYIASNTDVRLTSDETSPSGFSWYAGSTGDALFYIHDVRYRTYVLDTAKMSEFAPQEIPNLDRYNIEIPLLRYVA